MACVSDGEFCGLPPAGKSEMTMIRLSIYRMLDELISLDSLPTSTKLSRRISEEKKV